MTGTADVVVVGAGLSGLECAAAIVARGVDDVLVVDPGGGPAARPGGTVPTWHSTAPPHYQRSEGPPAVGGRSLRWHGVVLRLEDWALGDGSWPAAARVALCDGTDGAPALYEEVERDLADWAGRSLTPDDHDAARMPEAVLSACRSVPRAVRRDADGAERAYTPLDGRRGWLDRAERQRVPRIRARARALEVVSTAGRVSGVRVGDVGTGEVELIATRAVVLAAGTLENTRLVAQLLGADNPASFPGLNDHLVQGFVVRLPAAALGWSRPQDAFGYQAGDGESRSNLFARVRPVPGSLEEVLIDVWGMGEQVRSEQSHLSFSRTGAVPWPGIVTPGLDPLDDEVLVGQLKRLTGILTDLTGEESGRLRDLDFLRAPVDFARAAATVMGGPGGVPVGYSWPLGSVDHESGTLPLGGTYVDETGGLIAAAGGYVVGPATLPRSGASNPSLTTLALSRWTASRLVAH